MNLGYVDFVNVNSNPHTPIKNTAAPFVGSKHNIKNKKMKPNYKKKLDQIFSRYIRLRSSNNGYNQCVTCRKILPISELQCGHYVSRSFMGTRFDEENCHPQCFRCNCRLKGNLDEYALYLIQEYGDDILTRLKEKKLLGRKIKASEYKELIKEYGEKIKLLSE